MSFSGFISDIKKMFNIGKKWSKKHGPKSLGERIMKAMKR